MIAAKTEDVWELKYGCALLAYPDDRQARKPSGDSSAEQSNFSALNVVACALLLIHGADATVSTCLLCGACSRCSTCSKRLRRCAWRLNESYCLAGLSRSLEDRAVVVLQAFQPACNIGSVVGARC